MSRLTLALGAGVALTGAVAPAAATEPAAWSVEVGAAARARPSHLGASDTRVDAVPIFEAAYGDRLSVSFDDGAKWRAWRAGPVSAGPIAEYRQSFNDKLPAGAFRMQDAVEIGGFTEWRTPLGIAEARLRRAVNGYQGWSGDLSFSTGAPLTPSFALGGQARVAWADSNFSQEYFGLKPHAASRFRLPRFLDEDFVSVGGELDAAQRLTARSRLVLALTADRMVGELTPSPLLKTRNIFTASLGVTYRWSSLSTGQHP